MQAHLLYSLVETCLLIFMLPLHIIVAGMQAVLNTCLLKWTVILFSIAGEYTSNLCKSGGNLFVDKSERNRFQSQLCIWENVPIKTHILYLNVNFFKEISYLIWLFSIPVLLELMKDTIVMCIPKITVDNYNNCLLIDWSVISARRFFIVILT